MGCTYSASLVPYNPNNKSKLDEVISVASENKYKLHAVLPHYRDNSIPNRVNLQNKNGPDKQKEKNIYAMIKPSYVISHKRANRTHIIKNLFAI
jgi:hypothetical protein